MAMNDELKKAVHKSRAAMQQAFPKERAQFKALVLTNPNYFGNLGESAFPPIIEVSGNTFYEELGCVGYQPQQERLEGVVYIYQPSGYGTDICGLGTPEFVRFYISYDHGVTWDDQGATSFQAYNIPEGTEGGKRLEYAVSVKAHPNRKNCAADLLVLVRAILSWNNQPPPNQPNWKPIFGNVRDVTVLIEPLRFIIPKNLFEASKVKLPPQFKELIELDAAITTQPKTLGAVELASHYAGKGVPVHRFAYKELATFVGANTALSAETFLSQLPGVKVDPGIVGSLFATDGDTSYEELKCIGLDPNHPDTLIGVIQIKKANGYSGDPCTNGSKEYVTFWGDFDGNGSFETCLGTADVTRVRRARARAEGRLLRRAPAGGPEPVPSALRGGAAGRSDPRDPVLERRSPLQRSGPGADVGQPRGNADQHRTDRAGACRSHRDPRRHSGVQDQQQSRRSRASWAHHGRRAVRDQQPAGGAGLAVRWPDHRAGRAGVGFHVHRGSEPGWPDLDAPAGRSRGHRPVRLREHAQGEPDHQAVRLSAVHVERQRPARRSGSLRATRCGTCDCRCMTVAASFKAPTRTSSSSTIRSPTRRSRSRPAAATAGNSRSATQLGGNFVARDDYFAAYSLTVEPAINPPNVGVPLPSSGTTPTATAPGDPWTLDTTSMTPCGYVVRVTAVDRAIVDSQSVGHHRTDSVGFCLEEPTTA